MSMMEFDKLAMAARARADEDADEALDHVEEIESVLRLPPQQPTSAGLEEETPTDFDPQQLGMVHTAKGERRLREKIEREGLTLPQGLEEDESLSPSEKRAQDAERRAAWRKARLKSLENVSSSMEAYYTFKWPEGS